MARNSQSNTTIEIKWTYNPPNYFEEPTTLSSETYTIDIRDGCITATMSGSFFDTKPGLRELIAQEVEDYFLGAQPFRNMDFAITGGSINRYYPDGRKDTTIVIQPAVMKMKGGRIDLTYTDSDGVVHDTRRERIEDTQRLAELASKYGTKDTTARAVLKSYSAAVRDRNNELVHLYEIWESIAKRFNGESNAKSQLHISDTKRRRMGNMANNEPLKQGRHRGKHAGALRDATKEELDQARDIAREMIQAYLEYLSEQDI